MADLERFLGVASEAARAGGKVLRRDFGGEVSARGKGARDVVTETDLASERAVLERLEEMLPDHGIRAEESGSRPAQGPYTWIVDPLDGTYNFVMGIPHFSVVLTLLREEQPVVCVLFNPITDQLFAASKGGGTARNGRPIAVSGQGELSQAVIALDQGHVFGTVDPRYRALLLELEGRSLRVTRNWANAMDLALVASGGIDGYIGFNISDDERLGGRLLIEEAGGLAAEWPGDADHPQAGHLVASNGTALHSVLLNIVQEQNPTLLS
ncbi:MAG: inositol monophosphatase family protein [Acidimicrobiia bacterium]